MVQDVRATVGEGKEDPNASNGSAAQSFSREEIEAILAEQRREWQGRFTQATQELSRERRAKDELSNRLAAAESRLTQTPAPTTTEDEDESAFEEEWDSIDSGRKLLRAQKKLIRREIQRYAGDRSGSDADLAEEALRRAEEVSLDRDIERLRQTYRGMTDDQVNQVIELGVNTGQTDLSYLAFKTFGAAETFVPGGDEGPDPEIEKAIRARTKQRVLVGGAKTTAANAAPKTVKIRRGIDGYTDAEAAALSFFKSR